MYEEEQKRFNLFKKMGPPCYDGYPLAVAHDFLDGCQDILRNLALLESNGAAFTTFQL